VARGVGKCHVVRGAGPGDAEDALLMATVGC
jgi:hypothetical protein